MIDEDIARIISAGQADETSERNFVKLISSIMKETGLSDPDRVFTDIFRGFNRLGQGSSLPVNTDLQGLTFFTRPDLNLSHDNIAQHRSLTAMLTDTPHNYAHAIKTILDPRGTNKYDRREHPIVDMSSPFIHLLSNTLTSLSGWPDWQMNTYSSPEGIVKETWQLAEGIVEINGKFTLTADFQNFSGSPVLSLIAYWLLYMQMVSTGKMFPHLENVVANRKDYETRIYRFVLDSSNRFVTTWASTLVAMPTAVNIGAAFNYSRDSPQVREVDKVSTAFECTAAFYNDPIVLKEFNEISYTFLPALRSARHNPDFYKLHPSQYAYFNYKGYPIINLRTSEFEWWVKIEDVKKAVIEAPHLFER